MTDTHLFQKIQQTAFDLGFDHCAVTTPIILEKDQSAYTSWCESGSAGTMAYMTREPQKRRNPQMAFPHAKSVLTLGVSYYQGSFPEKPGPAYGRVARYAWGLDYHPVITERLERLLAKIDDVLGQSGAATLAVDTKPLLERALAAQSGLGFVGKNTLLIMPRSTQLRFHVGSWVFLAEILLDIPMGEFSRNLVPLPVRGGGRGGAQTEAGVQKFDLSFKNGRETPPLSPPLTGRGTKNLGETEKRGCGSCTKCITACPTNAFDGPYRLRADKCISYLTIENKGEIPLDMRDKMGDWLFGCDVCQEVCPFNARAYEARWPEFKPERGVGAWVSLQEILEIKDDGEFQKRFGMTPLSRPKRRGLVRNACVAGGNSGDGTLLTTLKKLTADSDPLISEHASWAVSRLSR